MSQHTPYDPAPVEPPEQKSEPPEPTYSQRRVRQPVASESATAAPKTSAPSGSEERPSRPSVRPSAFGAPRVSRMSAPPPAPPRESLRASAERASADDEEYDRDADTAPGLIVHSLPAPSTSSSPLVERATPIANTTSDRGLVRASPVPAASSASPQLQLVLARTSLPDAPSVMLVTDLEAPPREEPRRALTSIAVFAAMLCAAAVPLTRYALKSSAEEPPSSTHAAVQRVEPRAAPTPPTPPAGAGAHSEATRRSAIAKPAVAAQPERIDRLPGIMAGLPAEASKACEYLVDHAMRARDSSELQLAETLLGRASELDDRNPHPAFALARLRFEQGNYEGAEGWIVNAIRLRPRRAEYRNLYANILTRLGRENEARDERRSAQNFKD